MAIEQRIEEYVAEFLPDDPVAWCESYRNKTKIIHDALWGTFSLEAHEVALLDTPLIQRLRYLHQTGAVYLTYPSAHHTRFEHTVGVLCQAGRLCDALVKSQAEGDRVHRAFQNNVRMAALLHDTGHGPFSHTSEQFFSALPPLEEFRKANKRFQHSGGGEILSYLITQSAPFQGFLQALNSIHRQDIDCASVGEIITGTMSDDRMYMSEVIHGPFDADKLDYMPRDGMFSGLKMHVDVDRLFHSINIKTARFNGQLQTRIAGRLTGLSPLMQIMFNKMLLFTGMYHHHKVRAVDCMLWAVFRLAVEGKSKIGGINVDCPTDFLRLTDDRLLVPELAEDSRIKKILSDIRNRRLWKKALVIARNTVPETMHNEAGADVSEDLFAGVATLAGDEPIKVQQRRDIANQIWQVAGKPCEDYEVWLDVPKPPNTKESQLMWIDVPGTAEPQTLNDFIPAKEWVQLYGTHQSRYHVFCPHKAGPAIGDAAERVFYDRFKLKFLPQAKTYAK